MVVSIDDDHSPDDPDPTGSNGETDASVPNDPRDKTHEPGKDKEPDCFKLTTVATKGRPATTHSSKRNPSLPHID